ncbi:unnamed protein product [Ceratitis capitata]|uniref:(Mediterranean fruit fly) hypothetical protein n=1 Tax=Ceratitis capitata TaxID=7213 RepID=A0A811TWK0_CERCA|nr:unnamed protein product [Ceratitis capitata]
MVKGYSNYVYNAAREVEKRAFRCAEEFLNETKWILHNALILSSGSSSKEVFTAKAILKVCRQETNEIDTCAECYLNANTRTDWFVDVCSQPHLLLWAKLKGFPYWPAKAMGPGQGLSHVNDPNTQTGKRSARELADCIKEVEVHIEKIKSKVGTFKYAKFKTPYEPMDELQQLEMMIPGVTEYMKRQQALASTTESGNDSDHSVSPHKKASSTAACTSGGSSGASDAKQL